MPRLPPRATTEQPNDPAPHRGATEPALSAQQARSREEGFALVLTGRPGAGKTSVLTALSDTLSDADVPHAALEVEALRWTHPPLSLEEEMRHLRTVCGLLRDSGHRVLIIARTIEDDAEMAAVLRAINPDTDSYLVARLEAPPATLVARILAREPASWSGLEGLVSHARELAVNMPGLSGVGLVYSTEGTRAEDVADRIIARCPDQLGWTDQL